MTDTPRLIEHAFPLKQASLDSVHEKNVRHGHISTLHIWPARRPLAACRAALIATLLPDPSAEPKPEGMSDGQWEEEIKRRRKELCEKIGGRVVRKVEKKKMPSGQIVERIKEETEGGILHWGRETENTDDLEWFRQEIRRAYGGRAPKVLDPFAGGGAIPLEAMRLGCEVTAIDINPVAWFILKCTLEYPQKLAGQTRPLPEFVLHDDEFMRAFRKAHGLGEPGTLFDAGTRRRDAETRGPEDAEKGTVAASPTHRVAASAWPPEADLAWHVRAWGRWVLVRARKELARFYPTYADFEPLKPGLKSYERQPMQLVPLREDGTPDIDALNAEFTEEYLADPRNPRWIAKPTVAYLWARTVKCKNCRATVPLLKTRWLCKKANKRVLLTMEPNADRTGVVFGVESSVPTRGANNAAKREHDKRIAAGTMTRSGVICPCCGTIMTMEDIRIAGASGQIGTAMTTVVIDGPGGKEYRVPNQHERQCAADAGREIVSSFSRIPFGIPTEELVEDTKQNTWCVQYGLTTFKDLFTPRQLLAHGTFVGCIREVARQVAEGNSDSIWMLAVSGYLTCVLSKLLDYGNVGCSWYTQNQQITHLFNRFAIPMKWDFAETSPIGGASGSWDSMLRSVSRSVDTAVRLPTTMESASVINASAITCHASELDAVVTDPPYYDAIGYSVVMDFFYVWIRRVLHGLDAEATRVFASPLASKWDAQRADGELVDDASRHHGDRQRSKATYEDGMSRAFVRSCESLSSNGRLVIVFANKQPDAWETLVAAIIKAGFVVDGSWPIQTEMSNRTRAHGSSALASSVWLVCRKRPPAPKPGWDNSVLAQMRRNIINQLREFWDAGIRGPDFVWAATGPAMEAYSRHPVVKKADSPGEILTVSEFLTHVRRMVVDFVVGRVLSGDGDAADQAAADKLDEPTAYYLLHRHDFGTDEAPAGACILYATACGLTDGELADTWDILARTGGSDSGASAGDEDGDEADADDASEEEEGSGSKLKLKTWAQRKSKNMGYEAPGGKPVPLIDRVHRLMHLWKAQDVHKVDEYLDDNALRRNELFKRLLQSLIELSPHGSDERTLLESLSNHVGAKGAKAGPRQSVLEDEVGAWTAEPSSQVE